MVGQGPATTDQLEIKLLSSTWTALQTLLQLGSRYMYSKARMREIYTFQEKGRQRYISIGRSKERLDTSTHVSHSDVQAIHP